MEYGRRFAAAAASAPAFALFLAHTCSLASRSHTFNSNHFPFRINQSLLCPSLIKTSRQNTLNVETTVRIVC